MRKIIIKDYKSRGEKIYLLAKQFLAKYNLYLSKLKKYEQLNHNHNLLSQQRIDSSFLKSQKKKLKLVIDEDQKILESIYDQLPNPPLKNYPHKNKIYKPKSSRWGQKIIKLVSLIPDNLKSPFGSGTIIKDISYHNLEQALEKKITKLVNGSWYFLPMFIPITELRALQQHSLRDSLFVIDKYFLNPTAESSILFFLKNKQINSPTLFLSKSPSFRNEFNTDSLYRRDSRLREFIKMEQIFVDPFYKSNPKQQLIKLLSPLLSLCKQCGLISRIISIPPNELPFQSKLSFDLECQITFQDGSIGWIEVASASFTGTFQSKPLKIYSSRGTPCQIYNCTLLAFERFISVLRNQYK